MPSNKRRLYVALYPSGVQNDEERQYHWAFLIGPKIEKRDEVPGMRYHVKNTVSGGQVVWAYEELDIRNIRMTNTLLARFVIAKIEDETRLINILRSIPVVQKDPGWRCRTWLANALEAIARDGKAVGTAVLDWQKIETLARKYVADKKAAGRYSNVDKMQQARPTLDLIGGSEVVP